ncbi:MAG: hypothetical protein K5912_00025 [Alphaproteobacteria bacterium]|nr:hypothetical protein [Alphaproteobacteria bacterium]
MIKNMIRALFAVSLLFVSTAKAQDDCITVNRHGVESVVRKVAKVYRPNLSPSGQAMKDIVDGAMGEFYKTFTSVKSESKICNSTIERMCLVVLGENMYKTRRQEFITKCVLLKKQLAETVLFKNGCPGAWYCDETFAFGTKVNQREGMGLVQLMIEKYNMLAPKGETVSVYCAKDMYSSKTQDYMPCKIVQNYEITDRVFEFDSLTASSDSLIRSTLTGSAIGKIMWPGHSADISREYRKYGDDYDTQDLIKNTFNPTEFHADVKNVDKTNCESWNKPVKDIFGGYTKYKSGDVCEVKFFPKLNTYVKRGFDRPELGNVDPYVFKNMDIRNVLEIDDLLIAFLTNKAEQHGQIVKNVHCDKSPGNFEKVNPMFNDYYKYIRCYATWVSNKGEELVQDFIFTDTSEARDKRANANLSGFKCVTDQGGVFDGKNCSGISKEKCAEFGSQIPGGAKWDPVLDTCVLPDAKAIAEFDAKVDKVKKVVTIAAGVAIAIVAAVPSGGASVVGVLAIIGAVATGAGETMQQISKEAASPQITQILASASKKGTMCERTKGNCDNCCELAVYEVLSALQAFNESLWDPAQLSSAGYILDICVPWFEQSTYEQMVVQAKKLDKNALSKLDEVGKWFTLVGSAISAVAIFGTQNPFIKGIKMPSSMMSKMTNVIADLKIKFTDNISNLNDAYTMVSWVSGN